MEERQGNQVKGRTNYANKIRTISTADLCKPTRNGTTSNSRNKQGEMIEDPLERLKNIIKSSQRATLVGNLIRKKKSESEK